MAAMNKSLARNNKSPTGTGATKKRRRPTGSAAQFRGRRPKNNSRVLREWSGTFIRGWQEGHEPAVWYSCREDLDPRQHQRPKDHEGIDRTRAVICTRLHAADR